LAENYDRSQECYKDSSKTLVSPLLAPYRNTLMATNVIRQ